MSRIKVMRKILILRILLQRILKILRKKILKLRTVLITSLSRKRKSKKVKKVTLSQNRNLAKIIEAL